MASNTEIVSFYSFKGGTGRSTSLANASYALAERGFDVGCIDLDLAAPGLHMIYPEIGRAHDSARYIHDYILGNHNTDSSDVVNIDKYTINVGDKIGKVRDYDKPDGDLLLLPGAVEKPVDDQAERMVAKVREMIKLFDEGHNLDYILLDARSGLSSNIVPILHDAEKLFSFHRWTAQHKVGTKRLAEWLKEKNTPDELISVASNVPDDVSESDVEDWVRKNLYNRGFNDFHIINRSETLKHGEEVITLTKPEDEVSEQYRSLSDKLSK